MRIEIDIIDRFIMQAILLQTESMNESHFATLFIKIGAGQQLK